jgi:MFS family permease
MNPNSLPLLFAAKVFTGMTMTAFVTTLRASVADVLQGPTLAMANSASGLYSGIGIIVGPLLAARLPSDRSCYAFSTAVAAGTGGMLLTKYRETLPAEQRKEVDLTAFNPFR